MKILILSVVIKTVIFSYVCKLIFKKTSRTIRVSTAAEQATEWRERDRARARNSHMQYKWT